MNPFSIYKSIIPNFEPNYVFDTNSYIEYYFKLINIMIALFLYIGIFILIKSNLICKNIFVLLSISRKDCIS